CSNPSPSLHLSVDIPADGLADAQRAQLVYDTRSPLASGVATLTVNGVTVGVMASHDTVPGAGNSEWAHRSLDIPPALLHAGTNTIDVAMTGDVELDRLQLEIALDGLLSDGFESGTVSAWYTTSGG